MKKVFFLFALLLTVVCYAAPPPDSPTSFLTEDVGAIQSQVDIAVQSFEVLEVTFTYIGNELYPSAAVIINNLGVFYGFIYRLLQN